jgi:hypothetical protein
MLATAAFSRPAGVTWISTFPLMFQQAYWPFSEVEERLVLGTVCVRQTTLSSGKIDHGQSLWLVCDVRNDR